jgi:1,4-alpha-glucan branching enzyme
LLKWVNDDINGSQPWKITMAEDLQGNPWVSNETGASGMGLEPSGTRISFTLCVGRSLRLMTRLVTWTGSALRLSTGRTAAPGQRVIYTESHDEVAASNVAIKFTNGSILATAARWGSSRHLLTCVASTSASGDGQSCSNGSVNLCSISLRSSMVSASN